MHPYVVESFSPEEQAVLRRYVTNLDEPVFALVDLPEVVKGALYARYSRSAKSLRRLLLDEFAKDLGAISTSGPGQTSDEAEAATRAGRLYDTVFSEYGDDSVAQLGGAHVAVEQASNLLTKQLEWGRLAAYLEQSTRYIAYDDKPNGRYRYYLDPDIMASDYADAYVSTLDGVFDTYSALLPRVQAWAASRFPRESGTSEGAHRNAVKAKACDVLRGLLPAATVSNVGIFASGQAYEQLLLRLRGSNLAESRRVADLMLTQLRRVIPSFVTRVDRPDRGGAWSDYLASTRSATRAVADDLLAGTRPREVPEVTLVGWSDDAETDLLTGMLYPYSRLPESQLREQVTAMPAQDRMRVLSAYVGERANRRHKPGRALERVWYRFDICGDYGAFRDLQRHRMLTIEWQDLSPHHGYATPPEVDEAGIAREWHSTLERQADLYDRLCVDFPLQAQYAVGFAYRLRWSMQLNARAAMQMLELRTTPQGHPSYRRICQEMHRLIAQQAGHGAIAGMMSHVDHSSGELERLEAERAAEARLAARATRR